MKPLREAQEVLLHPFVVVCNLPFHSGSITNLLYYVKIVRPVR